MGIQDSVSKPFKKLKRRLTETIRKRTTGSRSDSHRDGGEADIEGSEAGQSSRLPTETEDVAKSKPSREENNWGGGKTVLVDSPESMPLTLPIDSEGPDSM